jgi:hypothetical protein
MGAALRHKARCIVVLVGVQGDGHAGEPSRIRHHVHHRVLLGCATGLCHLCIHRKAMPVIAQNEADITP